MVPNGVNVLFEVISRICLQFNLCLPYILGFRMRINELSPSWTPKAASKKLVAETTSNSSSLKYVRICEDLIYHILLEGLSLHMGQKYESKNACHDHHMLSLCVHVMPGECQRRSFGATNLLLLSRTRPLLRAQRARVCETRLPITEVTNPVIGRASALNLWQ
jgi:hypothetical protein